MRLRSLLVALLFATGLLRAGENPIPVVNDPFHRTVFENDTVRVLDVQVAPGATSQFHTHVLPSVIVYLSRSTNRSESWPDGAISTRDVLPGQSRYAAYDEKALSHRVTNTGTGLFRVLDIELLKKTTATGPWPAVSNLMPQWTEARVRSSNLALPAGAKIEISSPYAVLAIAIEGAVQLAPAGQDAKPAALKSGEHRFVTPTRLELRNENAARAEIVLLEFR